tara:strand:- start:31 stop:525 length:495 start_codon:yes stop_codon:yes gene_type:complete
MTSDGSGNVTINAAAMKATPAFAATLASTQSVSNATETKVTFNTEIYDTDNCYDNSTNYRFTPTTAGKYFVYATVTIYAGANSAYQYGINYIRKNGSTDIAVSNMDVRNSNDSRWFAAPAHTTVDMNGTTDYIEVYGLAGSSSSPVFYGDNVYSTFGAYKIIGA